MTRNCVLSLTTPVDRLYAKLVEIYGKQEELQEQLHNHTYMLKEILTELRILRYGKRARR